MRKIFSMTAIAVSLAFVVPTSSAQTTATADVTIEVLAVSQLSVSGDPSTLTLDTIVGASFTAATNAATTYSFAHNSATNQQITGILDATYSGAVTLDVLLEEPAAGGTQSTVTLSTTAQVLMTGIPAASETGLSITYTANAPSSQAPVTAETNTVTFTMLDV